MLNRAVANQMANKALVFATKTFISVVVWSRMFSVLTINSGLNKDTILLTDSASRK